MRPQTILGLAHQPFSNRSPLVDRFIMSEQVRSSLLHDLSDAENNFQHRRGPQQAFEDDPAAGSDVSDTEHVHTDDLREASHCATSPGSTRHDRSCHPGHSDQDEAMLTASSARPVHASIDSLDELLVQVQSLRTNQAHLRNMVLRQQADIDRFRTSFERIVARLLDLELMVNLRQA